MSHVQTFQFRLLFFAAINCLNSLLPHAASATPIMGNLPAGSGGYGIATEAGNTFGVALEFTPQENVSFDNVTLWISGYTGLDGSSLQLSLMQDGSSVGFPFPGPATTISTGTAAPNGGADAALTFNVSGELQAYTPYWFFLYLQVPGGGFGPDYGLYNCLWDQGGVPLGDVLINGAEYFSDGFMPSSFQSDTPAFAINSVPDSAPTWVLLLGAAGGCLLARHFLNRRLPE